MFTSDKPFEARKFAFVMVVLFIIAVILQVVNNRLLTRIIDEDAKAKLNRSRVE